ncbi:MAG: hypothetical protein QG587_1779 [Chloroflexota bacterium]|jgi:uncharacterized protein (DUF1499 family)|nr:hypothetical protein [Chloroflexota bacterium]
MELLLIVLFMGLLAAFAISASELGVDSRDQSDDPHRPNYPVGIA